MKTEIKDYLPLYLGCKFKHDSDVGTYELCGYNIYNDHVQNALGMDTYSSKGTRLILRKLSDMTEEERKELWRLVFSMGNGKTFNDRFKDFTGRVQFIDETTYYQVPRYIMMQGVERLAIESDGTVWADCDLHNWRHNQHEVTRWLLSKSFDLFGLIEQGLAIDKATLKASLNHEKAG
jgi:hypothetical protein